MRNSNSGSKTLLIIVLALVIGAVAWGVLNAPDQRTSGQKVGDAIDTLPQGIDKAAEQLQDRTPGEKLGDAVKDVGEDIKENTGGNQ